MSVSLSNELDKLAEYFEKPLLQPVVLAESHRAWVHEQLLTMTRLAKNQEREIEICREIEANRAGRAWLEREASAPLAAAPVQKTGNVFRPDFGRKQ